jgi:hypothetical protein
MLSIQFAGFGSRGALELNTILNQYNNRVCNHIVRTLYHLQLKVYIKYKHNINAISLQYGHNVNTCQTT